METPLALGDISKVQLWSVQLFTLMVLEHACSQTPEQLGCLKAAAEETAQLAIVQGGKGPEAGDSEHLPRCPPLSKDLFQLGCGGRK